MSSYRVISSDSDVVEPPDLWKTRIESRFRGREPNIVSEEDGDWWYCDGLKLATGFGFGGAQAGKRFDDPMGMTVGDTFENVRPGGYIPDEHLKDMDIDGVDVDIIYPTLGLQFYNVPDSELLSAVFRAYNDWLGEFCGTAPKRMSGIAMLNVDDVQDAVSELKRCSKMGFAGAMITVYPPVGKRYDQPEYEPLWAAARGDEVSGVAGGGRLRGGHIPQPAHIKLVAGYTTIPAHDTSVYKPGGEDTFGAGVAGAGG